MNIIRAILTGALIWLFIFIAFIGLSFVPTIKDSTNQQALIVSVLIIPFARFGASIFYKNGNTINGIFSAIIMTITAIALDAIITVPLIVIPTGGSYQSFFSFPLFWLLVTINLVTIYLYWRLKVKRG